MNATLTVRLEVKAVFDKAVRVLQNYLFLRRLRKLRERMATESEKTYTDEEIFEIVS